MSIGMHSSDGPVVVFKRLTPKLHNIINLSYSLWAVKS